MGQGLIRAIRATLRTNSWTVHGYTLTGDHVLAVLDAMPDKVAMRAALPVVDVAVRSSSGFASDTAERMLDRACQQLRKAKLATFEGGAWHRVGSPDAE